MKSSFIKASRAIRNAFATVKDFSDIGVSFQSLELFIRVQIWVLVIESDHKAQMNKVGLHVVEETASVHVRGQWPSNTVLHKSLFEVRVAVSNLPNFLQPDSVLLQAD